MRNSTRTLFTLSILFLFTFCISACEAPAETAVESPTETPSEPTLTATPDATETAGAISTATVSAHSTEAASFRATEDAGRYATQTALPIAIATTSAELKDQFVIPPDIAGELVYEETGLELPFTDDEYLTCLDTDMTMKNFVAAIEFTVPFEPSSYGWDIGFIFRNKGGNDQYRIYLYKGWGQGYFFSNATPDYRGKPNFYHIANEWVDFPTEKGSLNQMVLIADGDTGQLIVNGEHVADLDLSYRQRIGSIALCTEFDSFDTHDGDIFEVHEFAIWSLD